MCPNVLLDKKVNKQTNKYGHFPVKQAESIPWKTVGVDLIKPYTIKQKGLSSLRVHYSTVIDPATKWFEIVQHNDTRSITITNIVHQIWLSRYPWPNKTTFRSRKRNHET